MSEQKMETDQNKKKRNSDPDDFQEILPSFEENQEGEDYLLEEEMPIDKLAVDEQAERIPQRQTQFTEQETIQNDFEDRQKQSQSGREELKKELEEHHFSSPDLSGGDLDADWQGAVTGSGAETVGGSEPTPDQDRVDKLGQAAGLTYEDNEPLNTEKKLRERRQNRLAPPEEETTGDNQKTEL